MAKAWLRNFFLLAWVARYVPVPVPRGSIKLAVIVYFSLQAFLKMQTSVISLSVANAIGVALMLAQLLDYEWSRNSKFVMVCFSFIPTIIAIYNISVYQHEDRRIMSFGLSALALGFLSALGTLSLH